MPTKKWWKMAEVYRHFAGQGDWDFSISASEEMFLWESKGVPFNNPLNGYMIGKKWMDLTITEYWLPDLREGKTLFKKDLYEDANLPHWFLDKVLK